MNAQRIVSVNNEWGKLHDAFIGIGDEENCVHPTYMDALKWQDAAGIKECEELGGQRAIDTTPEDVRLLGQQLDNLANLLAGRGVEVARSIPLRYPEEIHFLDGVQKGYVNHDGCDFFLTVGNNVILLNDLRVPCRRKRVWALRPVLEQALEGSNARYVAMPPCSPHYREDDIYLERGDVLMDGFNVFVGLSGNASGPAGIAWLQQYLGPQYRVYTVPLHPKILHLDTVCMLNRPGLLTWYPEFIPELPQPLQHWEKIEMTKLPEEDEAFGANGLMLDEHTIVFAQQYQRLIPEYEKRGIECLTIPFEAPIHWGVGVRCAVGPLHRGE